MSTSRSPGGLGATAPCQPSSSVESSDHIDSDPDPVLLFPVTRSSLLTRSLLRLRSRTSSPVARRKREMIPTDMKDSAYWDKRLKNNQAAKRSREKRRLSDLMMEGQLLALGEENAQLRAQVLTLQHRTGLRAETSAPLSTSPLFPRPVHSPALFQPRLFGNSRGGPASILHPFEAKIPCLSSTRGVGGFTPQQGIFPIYGPEVSSSDDIHISTTDAFAPTPDTLHRESILAHRNWLVPHLSHPAVMCNNLLLPWRSSYLGPPSVYPDLPLYIQERPGPGLGVEVDGQWGFKSRAGLPPLGMHLSPCGR